MCIFYGNVEPDADTEAIADRLRHEFDVAGMALPAAMAELLAALRAAETAPR